MAFGLGREARFNRYFEGYEKRTIVDRNGNERSKFVYVLDYYQPQISNNAFILRKVINALLIIAVAAAQIYAGLMSGCLMNRIQFMGFVQCLGILAIILMAVYICIHLSAPYKMEVHTYKGAHEKFSIAAMIVFIVQCCIFVTGIVVMIVCSSFELKSFIWLLMYLISASCYFVIWILEKRTSYEVLPPDWQFK